jgi:hypothetical protein
MKNLMLCAKTVVFGQLLLSRKALLFYAVLLISYRGLVSKIGSSSSDMRSDKSLNKSRFFSEELMRFLSKRLITVAFEFKE